MVIGILVFIWCEIDSELFYIINSLQKAMYWMQVSINSKVQFNGNKLGEF